jgi:hypothetical protein
VVTYGLNLAGSGFALVIKSLDPEPPHWPKMLDSDPHWNWINNTALNRPLNFSSCELVFINDLGVSEKA